MKTSNYPRYVWSRIETALAGWKKHADAISIPNVTLEDYEKLVSKAKIKSEIVDRLTAERAEAMRERNSAITEAWDVTKKIGNAAKVSFGDQADAMLDFGLIPSVYRKGQKKFIQIARNNG